MIEYTVRIEGSITVNGVAIQLETRNDVLRAKRFLDEYLRAVNGEARPAAVEETKVTQATRATKAIRTIVQRTCKEMLIHALQQDVTGEGLAVVELLEKLKTAGWKTQSKEPATVVYQCLKTAPTVFFKTDANRWRLVTDE